MRTSTIGETQFACLHFDLLAPNPKTSEGHIMKTGSTNSHLCTIPPSHTQGHDTAFPPSSPPASPAAQWCVPQHKLCPTRPVAEVGHYPASVCARGKEDPVKQELKTTKCPHGAAGSAAQKNAFAQDIKRCHQVLLGNSPCTIIDAQTTGWEFLY